MGEQVRKMHSRERYMLTARMRGTDEHHGQEQEALEMRKTPHFECACSRLCHRRSPEQNSWAEGEFESRC